jgi:3-oxoacyl-[acyl-carrier protein] reductase
VSATPSTERVVLITGAAGGLGQALVREFLPQGWRVAAAHHRAAAHKESDRVWPVPLDVTDRARVAEVLGQLLDRWGRVDALIHNAGVTAAQPVWRLADEDWDRALAVNLRGAFLCAQAVLRPMLQQRDGHIINVSSFSGRAGARGQAGYATAKAGLLGLTTSLAREVGSRNVRVNAVLPGVLPTPMTDGLNEKQLAAFAAANALGRLNSVTEVARFIAFLAATQNISGQLFQLDSRIARWT